MDRRPRLKPRPGRPPRRTGCDPDIVHCDGLHVDPEASWPPALRDAKDGVPWELLVNFYWHRMPPLTAGDRKSVRNSPKSAGKERIGAPVSARPCV